MKKIVTVIIVATLLMSLFVGCGGGETTKGVVNVYNWGEYIDTDLIDMFEADTGIEVNYKTFESNEQMYSVLRQGGVSYDIVVPSDYMISRMINEDMLEKINFDNVSNYEFIDESLKNQEFDPNNEYSVPYMWGTVGIIFDPNVTGEVTSWSSLFDEDLTGQVLMFDNSRDAIGIALKYLGYSLNTTDKAELDEAAALLEMQEPIRQGWVMDQIFDKLESGEAAIGPYYAGDFLTMKQNNPNLEFCIPEEGSNVFIDAMCILKGAENKENAETFINYMTEVSASVKNAEYIGYTSPNVEAKDLIELDDFAMSIMYPTEDQLENCQAYSNLPQDILDYYDELWVKLKS